MRLVKMKSGDLAYLDFVIQSRSHFYKSSILTPNRLKLPWGYEKVLHKQVDHNVLPLEQEKD